VLAATIGDKVGCFFWFGFILIVLCVHCFKAIAFSCIYFRRYLQNKVSLSAVFLCLFWAMGMASPGPKLGSFWEIGNIAVYA